MIKLRSKRFCRGSMKLVGGNNNGAKGSEKGYCCGSIGNGEIKWELRPGGMLVQKRDSGETTTVGELITVKVSTLSHCHNISIQASSTFGELKMVLSLATGLEPREQRLLFKGKEREDGEYLHMVGVRDKDKVFLAADPTIKESKLHSMVGGHGQPIGNPFPTISV